MHLSHDCVRDLLLDLEVNLELKNGEFTHLYKDQITSMERSSKHTSDEVIYAVMKLKEAGFINADWQFADGKLWNIGVASITFEGHQFLDNIRSAAAWGKTKKCAEKIGGSSLQIIASIAANVITGLLNQQLKLP